MMCLAIYLKKYLKITDDLAFISPCIAKKLEISDKNCGNYVKYNVTFQKLLKEIDGKYNGVKEFTDELEYGLGAIYPMPGGLKENVEYFLGKENFIRQTEGEKEAYHFLNSYLERVNKNKELPFMVDILNCSKGCIEGTATEKNKHSDDCLMEMSKLRNISKQDIKKVGFFKKDKSPFSNTLKKEERLSNLMEIFSFLDRKSVV